MSANSMIKQSSERPRCVGCVWERRAPHGKPGPSSGCVADLPSTLHNTPRPAFSLFLPPSGIPPVKFICLF